MSSNLTYVVFPFSGKILKSNERGFLFIKPITQQEAMYLREHGLSEYVQRAAICKSYYLVETTESRKFLDDYRKSVTTYSYFK